MIRVSANRSDGSVKIQVEDDGVGVDASQLLRRRGIGLANTRSRLWQLYGELSSLSVRGAHGGTLVTMVLPYRAATCRARTGRV
jgi:sensor histidine kinase YesM